MSMRHFIAALCCAAPVIGGGAALAQQTATPAAPAQGSAALASPAPDLGAILSKYAHALGGRDLLSKIKTQKTINTFTLLGRTIVQTTTVKPPFYFLQVIQVEGEAGQIKEGFDGKFAWVQDARGVVQILSGSRRAEVITDAAGGNDSELFPQRWPTTLTLRPSETVGGRQYYVVTIAPKGGVAHDLLLDTATFQPIMDRTTEDGGISMATVDAFTSGPLGELYPKSVMTTSSKVPPITTSLRSIKDNFDVPNSIFSPPVTKESETI
jgi:hypothetical protein